MSQLSQKVSKRIVTISEDTDIGFDDEAEEEEGEGLTQEDLFATPLAELDRRLDTTEGVSVFLDLDAEERLFVSSSQQYLDSQETIRQLKARLIRRTSIIDDIRRYYLRDVVAIKHILGSLLVTSERQDVLRVYTENLPSLDLTEALRLHGPASCEMRVSKCGECGGQLEIVRKDSDEVEILKQIIVDCKDRESRFRIKLATLDAQIEDVTRYTAEAGKSHAEEKKFLYAEMRKVKLAQDAAELQVERSTALTQKAHVECAGLRETIGTLQKAQQQIEASEIVIENLRLEQTESLATLKVLKQSERTAKTDLKVCGMCGSS
ncbi:hypothetical protein B484DRAFT_130105 [Ochromonadaceae sp. CCMP2298]|nr:hypothetical protein B484DRAFT_130105 [Ochromonadaceae sp. CCMP2298]